MRLLLLALALTSASAQWQLQTSNTTASLRGIHAVTDQIAWASGTAGTVLHTTDGGQQWLPCTTPPNAAQLDFRGMQAFDAQTAIVMSSGIGDLSRLYKTTDACQTWHLIFTNPDKEGFWDVVRAEGDGSHIEILIVGDPVNHRFSTFQSTHGAQELHKFDPGGLNSLEGEGIFAASNSSADLNVDRLTEVFGTGGPNGARVFINCESCHNKITWNAVALPEFVSGTSAGVFSISNYQRIWVALGGDYADPIKGAQNAAYSFDDGREWHMATTFPHGFRSAVAYAPTHKAWITVGPNGTDVSTDDGKNWHPLRPAPNATPDEDKNWNALSLPFVVGPKGRIGRLRPNALP